MCVCVCVSSGGKDRRNRIDNHVDFRLILKFFVFWLLVLGREGNETRGNVTNKFRQIAGRLLQVLPRSQKRQPITRWTIKWNSLVFIYIYIYIYISFLPPPIPKSTIFPGYFVFNCQDTPVFLTQIVADKQPTFPLSHRHRLSPSLLPRWRLFFNVNRI